MNFRWLGLGVVMVLWGCNPSQPPPLQTSDDAGADTPDDTPDPNPQPEPQPDPDPEPRTVEPRTAVRSWILLSSDPETIERNLDRAAEWGIEEVQLSHDITRTADGIAHQDLDKVRSATASAKARGLRVMAWANELNGVPLALCFDPDDPIWTRRQDAYRAAFEAVPELDGVVLSFGSANPPPWFAGCVCPYCDAIESDQPPQIRPFRVPEPADRVRFITEMVHDVVTGELGKHVYARTFIHQPDELTWVIDGLGQVAPERTLLPMSKDVPNDWQPHYPLNRAIGAIEGRGTLMELDAAGEYWGQGHVPFVAVGYFERRIRAALKRGLLGYAIRVERGGASALDTPNEANLLAIQTFFDDPDATPLDVYKRWLPERYGIPDNGPTFDAMVKIHDATFEIGRRRIYQLGFWTLEKGSNIPTRCKAPALLDERSNTKWDPSAAPTHTRLAQPDVQVLADLRQEDLEGLEMADQSLALLRDLMTDGLAGAAVDDLHRRLSKQRFAAAVWMEVVEAIWARQLYDITEDPEHGGWILSAIERLLAATAAFEEAHPGDIRPLSAGRAEDCATDVVRGLPEGLSPTTRDWPRLPVPTASWTGDALEVTIEGVEAGRAHLEWGTETGEWSLAMSGDVVGGGVVLGGDLAGAGPWIRYRVRVDTDAGQSVQGSDFWLRRSP